jgi:hypothetical protein
MDSVAREKIDESDYEVPPTLEEGEV